ncbi:MAG: hypothetical protein ACTHJ6_06490, partial [Oryzihumus sp.]
VPRGADVLSRMTILKRAIHRFSYCDGRTLTVVVDWNARSAQQAGDEAVLATRLVWAQLTGDDPGEPLSRQVRPLRAARVPAGLREVLERVPGVLVDEASAVKPGTGRLRWRRERDDPDDDGGLAGVREPRRPKPAPPHLSAALEEPR